MKTISVEEPTPLESVEPNSIILTSYHNVIDLLREMNVDALRDAVVVISEPEPASEEMTEYDVVANWMTRLNIQSYRIRVSGHYYPIPTERSNRSSQAKKSRSDTQKKH